MANQMEKRKARLFLVDDHALVRETLGALLQGEPDLEVCGMTSEDLTALPLISQQAPDLVILDVSPNRSHGLDLLRALRESRPTLPVLVLSMHDETRYVERALQAGARGYITKEEATFNILPAVRQMLGGQGYLSDRIAGQIREKMAGASREASEGVPL